VSAEKVSISVRDVAITYRLVADKRPTMGQIALARRTRQTTAVQAVRGVSFDVKEGEIVGVIGPNGSGKSTLLRAIAGVQPIDRGQILVRSEPALLGVGAALSGRLSGARNVLLGCMALGMTRQEAEQSFDQIVGFAGVAHAIDRPLNTFSSGMRSRLHFAIATSIEPDILLIDEVLAVGDEDFKRRSEKRILRLHQRAKVVMVVSHGLGQIRKVCTRVIWLEKGKLIMDGDPETVVTAYKRHVTEGGGSLKRLRKEAARLRRAEEARSRDIDSGRRPRRRRR